METKDRNVKQSFPLTPVCDGDFAIDPKFCGLAGDGEYSSVYAGCYQSEGLPTSLHGDCYLHLSHLLQVNLSTQRLLSPLLSPLLYNLSAWILLPPPVSPLVCGLSTWILLPPPVSPLVCGL